MDHCPLEERKPETPLGRAGQDKVRVEPKTFDHIKYIGCSEFFDEVAPFFNPIIQQDTDLSFCLVHKQRKKNSGGIGTELAFISIKIEACVIIKPINVRIKNLKKMLKVKKEMDEMNLTGFSMTIEDQLFLFIDSTDASSTLNAISPIK